MKKSSVSLRFISWIAVGFLFLMGVSILEDNYLSGIGCIIMAAFFIPTIFDKFNFKFAQSNLQRRFCKTAIAFIGFIVIAMVGAFTDTFYENKVAEIKVKFNAIESEDQLIALIPLIDSSITDLPIKYHIRFDSIRQDIEVYKKYYSTKNSLVSQGAILSNFSSNAIDSFESNKYPFLAHNAVLEKAIANKINEALPRESDFSKRNDYLNFRLKHALKNSEVHLVKSYFEEIIRDDKNYKFDKSDFEFLVDKFYDSEGYETIFYNYVKRNFTDDFDIQYILSGKLYESKSYQRANYLVTRLLKNNTDNKDLIRLAGRISFSRKRNKTAIKYFEKLNELGGLDRESCNILRDLTKYIYSWHYYSICCDGSRSESTGRGTCSHHGGVCRSMKEPIYRYKYERCR